MKHLPKKSNILINMGEDKTDTAADPTPVSDISVQRLIDSGLVSLDREIRNINILSAKGKLDPASARDLRDHLKLLFELRDREKDSLAHITDEQLKELAKKVLTGDSK